MRSLDPSGLALPSRPETLDTEARLASDQKVLDAVGTAIRRSDVDAGRLTVTATANSRILHLTFSAARAGDAKAGVESAARAYLAARAASQRSDQASVLLSLHRRFLALNAALSTVDQNTASSGRSRLLRDYRFALLAETSSVSLDAQTVRATPLHIGRIVEPTVVHAVTDGRQVGLASGLLLGLVTGLMLGVLRSRRTVASRMRASSRKSGRRGARQVYARFDTP
jgi:hypothetical protein